MGESTKAVAALVMIVGVVVAGFAWIDDRPNFTTWTCLYGGVGVAAIAGAFLVGLQLRSDHEVDYLRDAFGTYFNRDGFCFAVRPCEREGRAFLDLYYQLQFEGPCTAQVWLRHKVKWAQQGAPTIDPLVCQVHCPPGGLGVVRFPIAIPEELQGKSQSFEVGAAVTYPQGKGERLRFHDGVWLRSDSAFQMAFDTALTLAGAAAGTIVLSKPATTVLLLPQGVESRLPADQTPEVETFWKLGDAVLPNDGPR